MIKKHAMMLHCEKNTWRKWRKKEKWPDDQSQILHNIFSPFFSFLLLFSPFEISNSRISLLRGSVFNNHAKSCYICTKLLVKILPA